ncbi:hypothetical protein [Nonomuraea sp. LPB2021202275-12-8]|uniref:hypothetical protein n=1 Tax=Nonomuraea sp. LPB2021202275-12-8 TaxID=3120159 RepID=UPI00300CD352
MPNIGPVAFSVRYEGEEHHFDLSDLPCQRLVRHLAGRVAAVAGEDAVQRSPRTTEHTIKHVRTFVEFIARVESDAEDFDLDDLTPELLEAFELHLLRQYGDDSPTPYGRMIDIVRLLREIGEEQEDVFDAEMQARLGFTTLRAKMVSKPLDAYPMPIFEAMQAAALADVRAIRDRILEGERLARTGQDPALAGWQQPENALHHIASKGPLTTADRHLPQMHRWLQFLGGIRALNSRLFLAPADLLPFLVLLICQTGLEPECVKQLDADCLVNPARGFVSVAYVKKRAHGWSHKTMRISDGGALHYPGGVLKLALRLTQSARDLTGSRCLWLHARYCGIEESFSTRRQLMFVMEAWMRRHGIDTMPDRGGVPARLDLRRLRKTYKSRRYVQSAGVLDDFAEGHSKHVAAGHYADIEAHRELHEEAVEQGLRQALDVALAPPVVLGEDGVRFDDGPEELEPEEVRAALSGHSDVWLASCKSFYASPYAIKKGAGCPVAVWGCLECPNAVFTTRHLPSLLSFLAFTEQQRDELPAAEWKARYGLAWERIVTGIRPKFAREQIRTAIAIAEAGGPHLTLPAQFLELIT